MSEPNLSVILVTRGDYANLAWPLACLRAQTVARQLEVIIVALRPLTPAAEDRAAFQSLRVLVLPGPMANREAAYASGVRVARATGVAFVEDHIFPEPGWAAALIAAFREPWAAVGPSLKSANVTLRGQAAFFFGYGHWALPVERGPVPMLSTSNIAFRRDRLMVYGDQLEARLMAQMELQQELRQAGGQLLVEPAAVIYHLDFSKFWPWVAERFDGGVVFGASRVRTDRWPVWRRLLYVAGLPLILVVNLRRLIAQARRTGRQGGRLLELLPALALSAVVHALGEVCGYLFGEGQARARHDEQEFERWRFVISADLQRANALAASMAAQSTALSAAPSPTFAAPLERGQSIFQASLELAPGSPEKSD